MKKETNKITTKLLKEMKPGEVQLFKGQTYAMMLSARSLICQANRRHGMEVEISYVEKMDGLEVTVKRVS